MKTVKEIKAEYNTFIENIPLYINKLKTILGVGKLTYTPEEIDEVHQFYEKNIFSPEKINCTEKELDDIVNAYIGTAYLWHFGGEWVLETYKNSEHYGQACIEKYGGEGYTWVSVSPEDWIFFIKTKQMGGDTLGNMFRKWINFFNINPPKNLNPKRDIY